MTFLLWFILSFCAFPSSLCQSFTCILDGLMKRCNLELTVLLLFQPFTDVHFGSNLSMLLVFSLFLYSLFSLHDTLHLQTHCGLGRRVVGIQRRSKQTASSTFHFSISCFRQVLTRHSLLPQLLFPSLITTPRMYVHCSLTCLFAETFVFWPGVCGHFLSCESYIYTYILIIAQPLSFLLFLVQFYISFIILSHLPLIVS